MPGKTALLAWELGGGLGHARRLLAIAGALRRQGWSPIVAARELWACADEYRRAGVPLLQAPLGRGLRPEESVRFRACSLADIMAASGYRDTEELLTVVSAWDRLIDMVGPAVVVADFSPILSLAAHGRVPVVAIGDGFVLPPPQLPHMPALRLGPSQMPNEGELLANAASVQRQRGYSLPRSLPALIGGAAHVVCTYPETDIYADHRLTPAAGPIEKPPPPLAYPPRPAIFAYLAADQRTPKLLQTLIDANHPLEIFLRDAPSGMKERVGALGVRVHETPPPLPEVAERAGVIVHHGGIGTIETCLALGRPQVLMPRHFEQWQNAAKVARLGTTVTLSREFSLAEGAAAIAQAISAQGLAQRAQEVAGRLVDRSPDSLARIVEDCERLGVT